MGIPQNYMVYPFFYDSGVSKYFYILLWVTLRNNDAYMFLTIFLRDIISIMYKMSIYESEFLYFMN